MVEPEMATSERLRESIMQISMTTSHQLEVFTNEPGICGEHRGNQTLVTDRKSCYVTHIHSLVEII